MKKTIVRLLILAVIVGLAYGAYRYFVPLLFSDGILKPQEAYTPITPTIEDDVVADYHETLVAPSAVPNMAAVAAKYGVNLSAAQKAYLDKNKFLLVDMSATKFAQAPRGFDEMLAMFDSFGGGSAPADRLPQDTVLVTPDAVMHAYHKYFELTLEELEQGDLSNLLGDFLASLHTNLKTAAAKSTGATRTRYLNLEAQIIMARVLFETKSPAKPEYFTSLEEEQTYAENDKTADTITAAKKVLAKYAGDLTPGLVAAISSDLEMTYKADGVGKSALFGQYSDELKTDFTQFTPRSHYTKNSTLRAYFRTMMYLGRSSYFLKKDIGITDATLLSEQFAVKSPTGRAPIDSWTKIMSVTGFYAGQSDDLTYTEWQEYVSRIAGKDANLASAAIAQKLGSNLAELRLPKILSDVIVDENIGSKTKEDLLRDSLSFRIFGQRFTFDAWILNSLTAGQEKTEVKLPSTPSALFIPAVMGDAAAKRHSGAFLSIDPEFTAVDITAFFGKLDAKSADIAKVQNTEWLSSMGSAWLYVLGSLTRTFDKTYPAYMQSPAFSDKQIGTFLGSYAELKHDTLLYAKQSYAELGAGGDDAIPPPVVKGFVEPNMEFWNRLDQLIVRTENIFVQNHLFENHGAVERLREFKDAVALYATIAKKELTNVQITDDEYERLRTTRLGFMTAPFGHEVVDEDTGKVALIADIHTDAVKGQILYEAVGTPYLMLAIVGNENTPRTVAGVAYNHYEFTDKLGRRLTDEIWKTRVYKEPAQLPAKNFWYASLKAK